MPYPAGYWQSQWTSGMYIPSLGHPFGPPAAYGSGSGFIDRQYPPAPPRKQQEPLAK